MIVVALLPLALVEEDEEAQGETQQHGGGEGEAEK